MEDQAPAQRSPPLPGSLLAVGVILLVLGVLAALGAGIIFLLAALGSAAPAEFGVPAPPEMVGAFMAFVIGIGVLATIDALAHLVIGVGVLRRRGWARVGGLVIAVLGIILTLVLSAWSLVPQTFIDPMTGLPIRADGRRLRHQCGYQWRQHRRLHIRPDRAGPEGQRLQLTANAGRRPPPSV